MDPNLFHIDWERTLEALVGIIVLAFIVERACALLFESRWWIGRFEDARIGKAPGDSGGPPSADANASAAVDNKTKARKARGSTEQKSLPG